MPGLKLVLSSGIEASRLLCPECRLILRDPVQTTEGVRLCRTCYEDIARQPGFTSPQSGVSVQADDGNLAPCFADKAAQKEILQLEVQCCNKKYGCNWIGRFGDYTDDHEHTCCFRPEPCPSLCGELVLKEELGKHLELTCKKRFVQCDHCSESLIAVDLEAHHRNECSKYPVMCELCDSDVPRQDMEEHKLNKCEYIQCTCRELLHRKGDISDPKSVAAHFENPVVVLHHLQNIFTTGSHLVQSMNDFNKRLDAIENEGASTETVKFSQELKQFTEKRFVDVVKQIEQLERNQAHQSRNNNKNVSHRVDNLQDKIQLLEDKSSRQLVEIKALQTQLQHQQTSKSVSTWDTTSVKHHSGNLELSRLGNLEKRYEDIKRQVTMFKVHVSDMELQLQASLASTYNGSFMWRIPDIKKRRRDAIDGRITSLYSPPFYTAKNGYKMCIRVYLNGDGMGHKTHLSLFFVLMRGEFDALLKWPFKNKVSLILVDQNHRKHIVQTFKPTPESSSFQRPISDMNVASGCPQFCKLSYLDDESYTKDDALFIKCIVDTSNIFHP